MPTTSSRRLWIAVLLVLAATGAKVALAVDLPLLADEAYYWLWSERLALGYFDHPPGVAWLIAATTAWSDAEIAVRAGAVACGAIAPLVLLPLAERPALLAALWIGSPLLVACTLFATPDAPLLAAWAVAIAAAWRGGRWWVLAGAATGVAVLAKATGLVLYPLLLLAAARGERATRWPWVGLLTGGVIASPWWIWGLEHGFPSLRHQVAHGLASGEGGDPLGFVVDQVLAANPLIVVAALAWGAATWRVALFWRDEFDPRPPRTWRFAWYTGVGPLVLFGIASIWSPAEANWAAPAWVGLTLGLASLPGRWWTRMAWIGTGLGACAVVLAVVHFHRPLIRLAEDPADRLHAGPALAAAVDEAFPPRVERTLPLYAERYQEAALLRYYAGRAVDRHPACGRPDQFDRWPVPVTSAGILIRPERQGPTLCDGSLEPLPGGATLYGRAPSGRVVGPWEGVRFREALP